MANSKDLIQTVASEIAASSKTSPTAAGQAKKAPATAELIDAINQTFALFRVNYHNQYYAAFGDKNESVGIAKKLWLSTLGDFGPKVILLAAEKIIADNDYLPTLHKMINACRTVGMPAGLPSPRKAYLEVCNMPSPKAAQQWSHPAVYAAGRDCGWHFLANTAESKAFPQFSETYQQYCERVIGGEVFTVEPPAALPETSMKKASKEQALTELDNLKQLLR
jgi:hypothetical protein